VPLWFLALYFVLLAGLSLLAVYVDPWIWALWAFWSFLVGPVVVIIWGAEAAHSDPSASTSEEMS